MYALVRALCAVKLTASDRIWPHMRAAGRSVSLPESDTTEVLSV